MFFSKNTTSVIQEINLQGENQIDNANLAILALDKLRGFLTTKKTITYGLKSVHWPGRNQMINKNPNMTTTSHDLVLMKYGIDMASAMNCMNTPNVMLTCKITK